MKFLAPALVLFSLISLTDPQGAKVWIMREQISSVVPPTACGPNANSKVNTGDTFMCVRESVDEVVRRLEAQ